MKKVRGGFSINLSLAINMKKMSIYEINKSIFPKLTHNSQADDFYRLSHGYASM